MSDLHVVILAAGKGTRMKSARPKVLHNVAGKPMIDYVMTRGAVSGAANHTVVVGHMKELLRQGLEKYPGLSFVTQEPQLGTGHALLQTAGVLERQTGVVLLLSGDVPLLQGHTLAELVRKHEESKVGRHRADGGRRSALRLRPHRPGERQDFADRGRARRVAGAAQDPARSTAACTSSRWARSSSRCAGWRPPTRRASTI